MYTGILRIIESGRKWKPFSYFEHYETEGIVKTVNANMEPNLTWDEVKSALKGMIRIVQIES